MGVTIHYSGRLKSTALIEELVDEMVEVANANAWSYQILEGNETASMDVVDDEGEETSIEIPPLNGITVNAEDGEPIWMLFDPEGNLRTPMVTLMSVRDPEYFKDLKYHAFTKTQFAGVEFHIKLVNLLKYISDKYFEEWNVLDESKYYETGDRDELINCMAIIDKSMAALNEAFEAHGDNLVDKSEDEIKDFITQVLGNEAVNINVVKISDDPLDNIDLDELLNDDEEE